MTPAAGPDSITWTGRRRPSAAVITPPFDCMTRIGAATPSAASSVSSRPEVLVHDRQDVGVGDGRARPLELAHLGQDLRGQGQRDAGRALADDRRRPPARGRRRRRRGGGRSRSTRTPSASRRSTPRAPTLRVERRSGSPRRDGPAARAISRRQRRGTSGARPLEVDVVQPREAQPPDLEDVAEALGREQPRARAAALEDRVGGDGRPVEDLAEVGRADAGRRQQLARARDDRLGVVVGGGQDLARERAARPAPTRTRSVNVPPTSTPSR